MDGSRRRLAPQDSLAILSLHRKFTILIATYCNNMIAKNPLTGAADDEALPPSQSELHRLHRALWRYGIYSKIFGSSKESSSHDSSMTGMDGVVGTDAPHNPHYTFSEDEIAHEFFGLFPIHEVEELACLQKYARDYYQSLVWDGDQLVALGPKQLYEVMTATSEDERELRIAEGRKAERVNVTMRAALDAYERVVSWGSWPWKGLYDKFVSERVPTTGWLWASSRGVQITDYRLRRWGYVFWDQERLHGWGITQEHMVHWPDPRGTSGVLVRQG